MGFSNQEYWSGFPCPPPRDLLDPGFEPRSPALQVDSLPFEPPGNLLQMTKKQRPNKVKNPYVGTRILSLPLVASGLKEKLIKQLHLSVPL